MTTTSMTHQHADVEDPSSDDTIMKSIQHLWIS
jgi:hypothetical protein